MATHVLWEHEIAGSSPTSPTSHPRIRSAVEDEPAQLVAQPLVVEHELADLVGKLGALPPALPATGLARLAVGSRRPRGLDRVGGGTELVGRDVADRRGLAGGVRGMSRGSGQVPGGGIRMAARRARLGSSVTSPRAQARPSSIARRGRSSPGRACSKWWSTCSAQSAAHTARRW